MKTERLLTQKCLTLVVLKIHSFWKIFVLVVRWGLTSDIGVFFTFKERLLTPAIEQIIINGLLYHRIL